MSDLPPWLTGQPPVPARATQWEYCVVGPVKYEGNLTGHFPAIIHATTEGTTKQGVTRKGPKVGEFEAMLMEIAKLGAEGWEMVGTGNVAANMHVLYFKRAKL